LLRRKKRRERGRDIQAHKGRKEGSGGRRGNEKSSSLILLD
jgi:hypothetical protein